MKTRNPFKRLARRIVIIWANYTFRKTTDEADRLWRTNHRMYYVASKTFRPDMLSIYDRYKFKAEKEVYGYMARLLTLETLKNGCYYHTPDKVGNQALTEQDKERRRLFFVRERLTKAGLL